MVEIMLHLGLINWFWGSRKVNLSCTKLRAWFMLKTTWTSYTNRNACPHGIQDDNKNHQVGEKKKLTMNIPVFKPLGSSHKCANINLPCKLEHSMCPLINNWQTHWALDRIALLVYEAQTLEQANSNHFTILTILPLFCWSLWKITYGAKEGTHLCRWCTLNFLVLTNLMFSHKSPDQLLPYHQTTISLCHCKFIGSRCI